MTKKEKLEKLTNNHEKKVQCAENEFQLELAIINKLPENIEPKYIHTFKSSSQDCSLSFEDVSKKRLLELASIFPALPMVKASGTFTSFIPEKTVDNKPEKYKDDTVSLIFPYIAKTGSCTSYTVEIKWYTTIDIKGSPLLTKIACKVDFPRDIATLQTQTHSDRYEGLVVDSTNIHINENWYILNNKEPMFFNNLKWGRGSRKYAHDYTIYSNAHDMQLKDIVALKEI